MTRILRSRDSYSRTLIAVCQRLDKTHAGVFTWKHPLAHVELQSRFSTNSVWVVGSFARGVPTCGDLDLVAEIDWQGDPVALPHKVFKALSIHHRGVSLCDGTPDNNSSLVAFGDAILIWDNGGQLDFYERAGSSEAGAVAIDLFTSLKAARNWIDVTKEDSECVLQPVCLPPKLLLSCIAACDAVSIDLTDYALTRKGAMALGAVDIVTCKALLDVLAG